MDTWKAVRSGEYVVTVSFVLREDTLWAKKGHELAFGQGIYQIDDGVKELSEVCSFEITDGNYNIGVRGMHFEALFDKGGRGLVSYVYAGREMIRHRHGAAGIA